MTLASEYTHRIHQLDTLFKDYGGPAFAIRCPMWNWHSPESGDAAFSVVTKNPNALEKLRHPSEPLPHFLSDTFSQS
jgi:hypothetical protein